MKFELPSYEFRQISSRRTSPYDTSISTVFKFSDGLEIELEGLRDRITDETLYNTYINQKSLSIFKENSFGILTGIQYAIENGEEECNLKIKIWR
jgi:hypothetical protein